MKKFKFRLQTVLEYRERLRDDCKAEVVKANQNLLEAQQELSRLESLILQNCLSIQDVMPASMVYLNSQISDGLLQRIENQKGIIVLREQDVAKAMELYMEASKELKAVTTLKERKLQEYNKHVAEAEVEYLDEMVTQRAARRS